MLSGLPGSRYVPGREAAVVWNNLRLLRSSPPKFAMADGLGDEPYPDRRREFSAAMEQFEQLMRAAQITGVATRPIPLFYAAEQAGRAILAALEDRDANTDELTNGHGLRLPETEVPRLFRATVQIRDRGIFPRVARTLGAEGCLEKQVALGALWNYLPDLANAPLPGLEWPVAIPIEPVATYPGHEVLDAAVAGRRLALALPFPAAKNARALGEFLASYPTASGWRLPGVAGVAGDEIGSATQASQRTNWGGAVVLVWPADFSEDDIAPQHRYVNERWLRPSLGEIGPDLPAVLAWWMLLYGLSIIARYHPLLWTSTLDVDASALAVPIEHALEEAFGALPHLVLEALRRQPTLLHRSDSP